MTPDPAPPIAPATLFLRHPAHFVAFGAGSGLSPFGPGTAGTLWAWMSFVVMDFLFQPWLIWAMILIAVPLGAWACQRTGQALGQPDHSAMVIDEIVAFWLILAFLPRQADSSRRRFVGSTDDSSRAGGSWPMILLPQPARFL